MTTDSSISDNSDEIDDIQQEIAMLSECASPYVTKYYGSYLNSRELWIVMELLTGGSANDLLKSKLFCKNEGKNYKNLTKMVQKLSKNWLKSTKFCMPQEK